MISSPGRAAAMKLTFISTVECGASCIACMPRTEAITPPSASSISVVITPPCITPFGLVWRSSSSNDSRT